jgi:hypothetical protein
MTVSCVERLRSQSTAEAVQPPTVAEVTIRHHHLANG